MQAQKIMILGTGGTIAGRSADPADTLGYVAAQVGIDQLVAAIPALADGGPVLTEQVAQIDSKDMSFAVWRRLADRALHWLFDPDVQGLVITHGTDTLEETAYFLQAVCNPAKPVVLTCAMRPATAPEPDGPQNLLDALVVARHPLARGVVAVCAGVIHSARDVQKVHTQRLDAFSSGDAGPIGHVKAGAITWARRWPSALEPRDADEIKNRTIPVSAADWPRVEIVMNHAGADGRVVDALMAQGGLRGLVVAATGNGTLHTALEAALLKAQVAGVQVVRATRCLEGQVVPTAGALFPDSQGLSPVKARVALMLALMEQDRAGGA